MKTNNVRNKKTKIPVNIPKCGVCGNYPVLLTNTKKQYAVVCFCGNRTEWKRKGEVLIDWTVNNPPEEENSPS